MTTEVYGKYQRAGSTNTDIESWFINDVLFRQKESILDELLVTLNTIKRNGKSEIVNIPILSNNTFKGIFKKKSNTEEYTSFDLKIYDGLRLKKEYFYKKKVIEIPQLKEIYDKIDDMSDVLSKGHTGKDGFRGTIMEIDRSLDAIIKLFENTETAKVDIVLDSSLTIQIYLKKDSMVIKFKLKNSVASIGYINDPFVIYLYSKIKHLKDNIKLIVWNFSTISGVREELGRVLEAD